MDNICNPLYILTTTYVLLSFFFTVVLDKMKAVAATVLTIATLFIASTGTMAVPVPASLVVLLLQKPGNGPVARAAREAIPTAQTRKSGVDQHPGHP